MYALEGKYFIVLIVVLRNRYVIPKFVQVIEADQIWRQKIFELEQVKKELNAINKEIGQRKKVDSKSDVADLVAQTANIKENLPRIELETEEAESFREKLLRRIGNLVDLSVLAESDEGKNEVMQFMYS